MACVQNVGRGFFPLDEELQLLPGKLTPREHERLVRLAGWIPSFEKAVELFGDFLGIEVGKITSQRYTEEAGAAYEQIQKEEVEYLERYMPPARGGGEKMQLSADGAMVPLLHGVWAEVRTLVIGDVQPAVEEKGEMEEDSAIEDPILESSKFVEEFVTQEILNEMDNARWTDALNLLKQAQVNNLPLAPILDDSFYLNNLCWDASLGGFAAEVLEYCERAVTLAPDDAGIRDSRGLARALTGDFAGAIEDFQFFIDSEAFDESLIQQRREWILDLKAGINPFSIEVLEELRNQ